MKRGKAICESLKEIRRNIARANEIEYEPTECRHEGDCAGTCPKCESEVRWLEGQLRMRQSLGKAVTIAGLTICLGSLPACNGCSTQENQLEGEVVDSTLLTTVVADSTEELAGEVMVDSDAVETVNPQTEPQEINGVTQPEDPNDNRDCPSR